MILYYNFKRNKTLYSSCFENYKYNLFCIFTIIYVENDLLPEFYRAMGNNEESYKKIRFAQNWSLLSYTIKYKTVYIYSKTTILNKGNRHYKNKKTKD